MAMGYVHIVVQISILTPINIVFINTSRHMVFRVDLSSVSRS